MEFSVTLIIIIVTCIVSLMAFSQRDLIDELSLWPYMVDSKKQYYRFVTAGFVHADLGHLFFNMFSLYFGGRITESLFDALYGSGHTMYVLYYILAVVVADIPSYLRHRKDYGYRSIGASGAVSACIFTTILIQPWGEIYVYFIKMPAIAFGVLYLGYSVYMSRRGNNGINHDAHLWGAIFGIVYPIALRPELGKFFIDQFLAKFA